jgi:hypothetical protein
MPFIHQVYSTANGTEKAMQVAGEEVFFPLGFGNNWGKLRIGLRCYAYSTAGMQDAVTLGVVNYNDFRIGAAVCNGSQGFFTPGATDVVGIYGGTANGFPTVISVAAIPYSVSVANGYIFFQRQGANTQHVARTNSTGSLTVRSYISTNVYWSLLYFDFDRVTTSGSIVSSLFGRTTAQIATVPNASFAEFLAGMNTTTTPANMTNIGNLPQTTAYAGTLNYFDTVSIFCNATANFVLDISHVAVARQL